MSKIDNVGRWLLIAAAVIWLAVIGVSVAAIVALVGLGSAHAGEAQVDSQTPWGLYAVIGISVVIIATAIPLLLRARRSAPQEQPRPVVASRAPVEAPTEKLRVFGSVADPRERERRQAMQHTAGLAADVVDRVILRFVASMATATGAATLAVAVATYCMAAHTDGGAWAALVIAGLITVAMPVIPWLHLRELSR